jgi:cytochrome c-type biogenesis protein CcmH
MTFWIFAIALLAVPALIMSWPLFFGSTKERMNGVLLLLIIPLAGLVLYQVTGTPEALDLPVAKTQQTAQAEDPHSEQQGGMNDMVAKLQQRMAENPNDPDGWLILGRTLKTMKRYKEAATALANANRLIPNTPLIMIELVEARLFESGRPQMPAESRAMLEAALKIDMEQQKGLWLLGMAAAQDGDDALAITVWKKLLSLLEPASGTAESLTQQIEMAQTRLGQPVTEVAVAEVTAAEFGIPVTVTIADDLAGTIAPTASLFVFIHPAGTAGMPLAVKRLAATGFPLSLNFNDADLLRPGNSLENFEQLDISARISMSGTANKAPGDYQANLATLNTKAVTEIALHLDQRVP